MLPIFHYVCHYPSCGIYYVEGEENTLRGYIDADFAQDVDDWCSIGAYIFMLGSSPMKDPKVDYNY